MHGEGPFHNSESEEQPADHQVIPIHPKRDGGSGGEGDGTGFRMVIPEVPEATIRRFAAKENAEERVEDLAENRFWALNPLDHVTESIEAIFRRRAVCYEEDSKALGVEAKKYPPMLYTVTTRPIDPDGYSLHRWMGQVATIFMVFLFAAAAFGVATGIQQSGNIPAVTRDWELGLLFGITALAGIFSSKIIRIHLSPDNRTKFDIVIGIATVAALGFWLATFASTFLAGNAPGKGFASLAPISLEAFYISHLLLDFCASASLLSLIEYGVTHGRDPDSKPNPVRDAYSKQGEKLDTGALENRREEARCNSTRERLNRACEGFVSECLGFLEQCRAERAQSHAAAEASYHQPTIVPIRSATRSGEETS